MSAHQQVPEGAADLRERYRRGGLMGKLTPGSAPAVVVVDLQNGFTDTAYAPGSDLDDVVVATRRLIDVARAVGIPVVFTTIAFPSDDGIAATGLRKMPAMTELRVGTASADIDDRLDRLDDERLVVKQTASAFAFTDLADHLEDLGVDHVLVTGATTSGCVRATVVDACAANIPAFVVRECVGDRESGPHHASLLDIDAKYGDVISLETAIEMMRTVS